MHLLKEILVLLEVLLALQTPSQRISSVDAAAFVGATVGTSSKKLVNHTLSMLLVLIRNVFPRGTTQ